ncbi:tetratricopeptide repeat protein [bacterium]|nr:tetratricopeptide repeat protein [bacterium]
MPHSTPSTTPVRRPAPRLACRLATTLALTMALGVSGGALFAGTTAKDKPADPATEATPPAAADLPDVAGAYLAARQAAGTNDYTEAARWYDLALQADPQNLSLLEGDVTAHLALGDLATAAKLANLLTATGSKSQIAAMALLADDAQRGDFAAILKAQADGATIGQVMDQLINAWSEVGIGKMSDATATFDKIIATPGMQAFGLYHKALALAQTGDFEGAEKLLSDPGAAAIQSLRRGVLAQAEILSQLERAPDAVALIDKNFGPVLDDGLRDLRTRLVAGQVIPFDVARTPQEGIAEAFYTLATVMADQADETFTLMNARIATILRPDHIEAKLMVARILDKLQQFDLAVAAYAAIPEGDPAYVSAAVGQANAAMEAGRPEDAVTLLKALADKRPMDRGVLTAYGDALRRQDHCDAAIAVYGKAIALIATPQASDWPLYYRRGGCEYAQNDWPAAEADYKAALALAPNEPRLLNELGYGYVDRGEHLDEALAMIQKAVAAAPDQGYIIDSLAWAYFRLGRYQDAVAPQEKASLLMPVDAVVTDHLGDVYWMVGRKREAQYQWHRALSFNPEDKDAARIRRKLEVGLDQVMKDEKAQGDTTKAPGGNGG